MLELTMIRKKIDERSANLIETLDAIDENDFGNMLNLPLAVGELQNILNILDEEIQ